MKSGSTSRVTFPCLETPNCPSAKDCLFVSLLLLLLTMTWLDTDGKTEEFGDGLVTTTPGVGGRLPAKVRRHRTPLSTAGLFNCAGNNSDPDSTDTDSAVGEDGENCPSAEESDGEPPSEVSCLASELRRNLRLDSEGDGGFAEPGLCPGQLGLMTLGGEYKPMAVAYAECSRGLSWCRQAEQCLPLLRDSVVLRRESWPFLPGAGALGGARPPTQTWRSVTLRVPHSCYCGSRHQEAGHQPQPGVAQEV